MSGPAEKVWEIFTRQQIIEGLTGILAGAGMIFLMAWAARFIWKHRGEISEYDELCIASIFVGLAFAIMIFAAPYILVTGIQELINPEYFVIKDFMDALSAK